MLGIPKTVMDMIGFPHDFYCDEKDSYMKNGRDTLRFYRRLVDWNTLEVYYQLPQGDDLDNFNYFSVPVQAVVMKYLYSTPDSKNGGLEKITTITIDSHTYINQLDGIEHFEPQPLDITCINKTFGDLRVSPLPPNELTYTTEMIAKLKNLESGVTQDIVLPKQVRCYCIHLWALL